MATPALIIGLGGTGVKVLTHVKQDLLATHNGQMPDEVRLLAFDTERETDVQVGAVGTVSGDNRVSAVRLGEGEYVWIGGNVRPYVQRAAKGELPHVSSWLQARYYLDTLPDTLFFLEKGAGMLRQFGRLSIFHDVSRGEGLSSIYSLLLQAINRVQKASGTNTIEVVLISSVAGGTGAGMFVDLAYLVRQIARLRANQTGVTLRGFLVMPEAFQTIPGGVTRDMRARAYAAMRENKRFMVNFDWDTGYPMYYHGIEAIADGEDIWQGRMKNKLFDFLYYLDGRREKNSLADTKLDLGIAPTLADMVVAILDEEGGQVFGRHTLNLNDAVGNRGVASERTAFYGTVGTYSFVFPIYHITEDFAHRLALEALDVLLKPESKKDGVPTDIAASQNMETGEGKNGRELVNDFLNIQQVSSYGDAEMVVSNTLLTSDVRDMAGRFSPAAKDSLLNQFAGRTLESWMRVFTPPGASAETTRLKVEAIVKQSVLEVVPTSDQLKEKAVDGIRRIEDGVKAYKNKHLGGEREGGRRDGGEYRSALIQYQQVHLERFRDMLTIQCQNLLNGSSRETYRLARGGKLGFLIDFLDGLAKEFDIYIGLLRESRELREARGGRRSAVAGAMGALDEMKKNATAFFPGKAMRAQRQYLEPEQHLIDLMRIDTIENMVLNTVMEMHDYVQAARNMARAWADTLGIGGNSLYADLLAGSRQVQVSRQAEEQIPVRKYIRDEAYEQELYELYGRDQLDVLLEDMNWHVETVSHGKRLEFSMELTVQQPEDENTSRLAVEGDRKHNVQVLLTRSRRVFREMWQTESILKYLRENVSSNDQNNGLGKQLFENGGALLSFTGGNPIPANYLRASYGEDEADQRYLFDVKRQVADLSHIADEKFAQVVRSSDRFKLSLIYTLDLIPLDGMTSYSEAEVDYKSWQGSGVVAGRGRDILHIFPAEVSAVKFEERAVRELEQESRLFDDKVVLQLETIDRFRLFTLCHAFGLIGLGSIDEGGALRSFYRLLLPEETTSDVLSSRVPSLEIRLTELAASGEANLLEAVGTFNYIEQDVRHELSRPIPYDRVERALLNTRRIRAKEYMNQLDLSIELRETIAQKSEQKQDRVRALLGERDYLTTQRNGLIGIKSEEGERPEDAEKRTIRELLRMSKGTERDLYTVMYLILTDHINTLSAQVRDLLR